MPSRATAAIGSNVAKLAASKVEAGSLGCFVIWRIELAGRRAIGLVLQDTESVSGRSKSGISGEE